MSVSWAGGNSGKPTDDPAFQAAARTELVEGDLKKAIQEYEALAQKQDRALAASALLRIAACYEKLSDVRAVEVYERIAKDFSDQKNAAKEASKQLPMARLRFPGVIGWYNGEWPSGIPSLPNKWISATEFSRIYDDFEVPAGGWTVVAVFSDNKLDGKISKASWEIRTGMGPGNGGKEVAAGVGQAVQVELTNNGEFRKGVKLGYRIQVSGLNVRLEPGRYWLSVTPVTKNNSILNATLGKNAVGNPPGSNGQALYLHAGEAVVSTLAVAPRGQFGQGKDFSQGVIVRRTP